VIFCLIAKSKERVKIYLISEGMSDKKITRIWMFPANSTQSLLDNVLSKYEEDTKILVLPTSSIALPLLEEAKNWKIRTRDEAINDEMVNYLIK